MKLHVECNADFALARVLGAVPRDISHDGDKGRILKAMRESDLPAVGLLDEDPGAHAPHDLQPYEVQERTFGLELRKHRRMPRKILVVINPRLEEWLYARSKACTVDPVRFRLPPTARELHRDPRSDKNRNFKMWISTLSERDDGLRTLKQWIVGGRSGGS